MRAQLLSCVRLCDPMGCRVLCPWNFSGKNTGVGCHLPTPGDLPDPGIEPKSHVSPALGGVFFTTEPLEIYYIFKALKNMYTV